MGALAVLMIIYVAAMLVPVFMAAGIAKLLREYTYWNHHFIFVLSLLLAFVFVILSFHFVGKYNASKKKNRRSGSD